MRSPVRCTAKSMMVVVPPWAAARVPVSKVSEAKVPPKGSSMWVWTSTPPGMTYLPAASIACSLSPTLIEPGSPSSDDALAVDQDVRRRSPRWS